MLVLLPLVVSLILSTVEAVSELSFLELGTTPDVDHIFLPAEDDAVSDAISVPGGLPIFGNRYSEVYVMANGLVYLDSSVGECCPLDFSDIPPGSTPLIAPFWVDSDPSVRGNVSYEVHPSPCSPLVQQVSEYISASQSVDFCGTWMMVAYWWDVPEVFLDDTSNTNQGIVITDGEVSYTIFIYQCELLEPGAFGAVGYYINSTHFQEHSLSNTEQSSMVACQNNDSIWSALMFSLNDISPTSCNALCVNFAEAEYTVAENRTQIPVCLISSGQLDEMATVNLTSTTNDFATAAELYDFVPIVDEIVFEAGERHQNVCFTIHISDDNTVEEEEVFYVIMFSSASRVFIGKPNRVDIVIADDDYVEVGFERKFYSTREGSPVEMTVIKNGSSDIALSLYLYTQDGTATAPEDYINQFRQIKFQPSNQSATETLSTRRDFKFEGEETFYLIVFSNSSQVLASSNATVVIEEDSKVLSFLELGVTPGVELEYLDRLDDHVSEAIIPSGRFPLTGTDHDTFHVMANGIIFIGGQFGECCPLSFSELPPDTTPFIAPYWIDSDPSVRGNVSYEAHNTSSPLLQQVSDYISVSQNLSFSGTWMMVAYWWDVPEVFLDDTSNTYQAVIITDGVLSYAIFIYKCGALEDGAIGSIGYYFDSHHNIEHPLSNSIKSSTIACNDSTNADYPWKNVIYWLNRPRVQFSAMFYTVSEAQRSLNVCLVLDSDFITPLVVDVSIKEDAPLTATGGGVDFTSGSLRFFFPRNKTLSCAVVWIVNDSLALEGQEQFVVNITSISDERVLLGINSTTTVCIEDSDEYVVSFNSSSYEFTEGDSNPLVCLLGEGETAKPAEIMLIISDSMIGTTTAPFFDNATVLLSSYMNICLPLRIVNDTTVEGPEQFTLTISSTLDGVRFAQANASLTIVDDDMVEVSLEVQSTAVREGSSIALTLRKLGEADIPISVILFTNDVTAKAHEDYIPLNLTVTFPHNESTHTTICYTIDDSIIEGNEIFAVKLSSNSSQVLIHNTESILNITIVELLVNFSQNQYTFNEGENGSICMKASGKLDQSFKVDIQVVDDTTIAGEDYYSDTVVHFEDSVNDSDVQCIQVSIFDDSVVETMESFNVSISANHIFDVASPSSAVVFISDNTIVVVGFQQSTYSVLEGNSLMIELQMKGRTKIPLNVSLTVSGSAKEGEDYAQLDRVISWPIGLNVYYVRVDTFNDTYKEENEEVMITIANDQHIMTENANTTVIIIDSEHSTVQESSDKDSVPLWIWLVGAILLLIAAITIVVALVIVVKKCSKRKVPGSDSNWVALSKVPETTLEEDKDSPKQKHLPEEKADDHPPPEEKGTVL